MACKVVVRRALSLQVCVRSKGCRGSGASNRTDLNLRTWFMRRELSPIVGDGLIGQAAAGLSLAGLATTSSPSANFTPRISFGNWLWPSRRRHLFCAASTSLKTMASAVRFDMHPFDRIVRWRTVANVLSMGFVVRKCFQCSARKS